MDLNIFDGVDYFRRLAKSTLLLIPLFGINFIVFAFIPEQVKTELRLVFDLILGSFQVTHLYLNCFYRMIIFLEDGGVIVNTK